MDILNLLLQPNGFWENIIFSMEKSFPSYAITLIIMTLIIKAVLIPFDFYNRYITKVNSRKQAIMQPEVAKLEKAYASNPQVLNQKKMELYKRENFSVMGSCLGMLLNLVITSIVFFSLFAALNNISTYKQAEQFITLRQTYNQTYDSQVENASPLLSENEVILNAQSVANEAVKEKYGEIKESFLWIKNIWREDTTTDAITSYKSFNSSKNSIKKEVEKILGNNIVIDEVEYNKIMNPVKEEYGGNNGLFILIVLSAGINFLSMKMPSFIGKYRAKKNGTVYTDPMATNKIMLYIMPAIMALFTLLYTSAFGLYIVTGAFFSLATSPIVSIIIDNIDNNKINREKQKTTVSYSRKK